MDWSGRARRVFDRHRHADGRPWTGAEIERATGGSVSRFYVSLLLRGLIREPSFSKIYLISRAVGANLHEWVDDHDPPDPIR